MSLLYYFGRWVGRFIFFCTMRSEVINRSVVRRQGGYLLAVTHLSHLEPICLSILNQRPIDWITRKEFFRFRPIGWMLYALGAIKINRQGIPVSSIRAGISRARAGRIIGICPEGCVKTGADAAIRRGTIRKGCCSIALRAGVPVVPCVVLGTHKLNEPGPWIPFRRARIWVAYGKPIYPPPGGKSNRALRQELADRIVCSYRRLYAELCQTYCISDCSIP
jgi:1-acyl-sn-glycerol-3-phosphate acyltransferase